MDPAATRRAAEAVLFDGRGESTANLPQPKRRRVRTHRCANFHAHGTLSIRCDRCDG
jgi:hypothetical protein